MRRYESQPGAKFRYFLSKCLRNFLIDQIKLEGSEKSIFAREAISLDLLKEQSGFDPPSDPFETTPQIDIELARYIHDRTMRDLRHDYQTVGKGDRFEVLKVRLFSTELTESYATLADQLGTTEPALKQEKYRLSHSYYESFRNRVMRLVEPERHGCRNKVSHLLSFSRFDRVS